MTTPQKKKHVIQREAPLEWRVPMNTPKLPKFSVVYADPAWQKGQRGAYGAEKHYDLMTTDLIKKMPVKDLVADNAHLYLWTTNGCIPDALEVIKAWGFTYQTAYTWLKLGRLGLGCYLRNCTETLLFATRGKAPVNVHNQANYGIFPVGRHSEKPREIISMIERLSDGPYLELFCRKRPASNRKDWYCWGNEVEASDYKPAGADIYIPGYPVPKYSFDPTYDGNYPPETNADSTDEKGSTVISSKDSTNDSNVTTDSTTADSGDGKGV